MAKHSVVHNAGDKHLSFIVFIAGQAWLNWGMNLIAAAKQWLSNSHIIVPDEWLQACVDWINEENQGAQLSQDAVNSQVYEQWLLSDLRELETLCLPSEVSSATKFELNGAYALQIDSILDVGKSFYSQQQKFKGTENANARVTAEEPEVKPWEMKPTRMLMMKLTDGQQTVQGMEYRPIASLSPQTPPGTKILVHGTILCRHGILMLSENSIQVLGGEVDTLVESNTMLNTLQSAMDASIEHGEKHYRQEFRGSEIIHSQKPTASQLQHRGQQQQQPWKGTSGIKQEVRSQRYNPVKTEPPSQRTNIGVQERNRSTQVEMDNQWGDDDDDELMDVFMDEMDMDDFDPPATQNTRAHTSTNNSALQKASKDSGFTSTGNMMRNSNQNNSDARIRMRISGNSFSASGNLSGTGRQEPVMAENSFTANKGYSGKGARANSGLGSNANNSRQNSLGHASNRQTHNAGNKSGPEPKIQSNITSFMGESINRSGLRKKTSVGGYNKDAAMTDFADEMDFDDDMDDMDFADMPEQYLTKVKPMGKQTNVTNKGIFQVEARNRQDRTSERRSTVSAGTGGNTRERNIGVTGSSTSGLSKARTSDTNRKNNNSETSHVKVKISTEDFDQETNRQERKPQLLLDHSNSSAALKMSEEQEVDIKPDINSLVGSNCPFTYINRVMSLPKQKQPSVYTVKAFISTLISRLSTDNGKWSLACKINDGTMALDVDISDKVLTEMIGFSCEQSMVMRMKAKQDPAIKDFLKKGIQNFQQKLVDLMCLLELEVSSVYTRPIVVAVRPVTTSDINLLYNRVMANLHMFSQG